MLKPSKFNIKYGKYDTAVFNKKENRKTDNYSQKTTIWKTYQFHDINSIPLPMLFL